MFELHPILESDFERAGNVAVKFVLTMGFHIFLALQEYNRAL